MSAQTPIIRWGAATDANSFIDFAAACGAVTIKNYGPDPVFFVFDGAATAAIGNDVGRLNSGEPLGLPNISFSKIGIICAAGQTAELQAIATVGEQT